MGRRLDTWPYGRTALMNVTYTQANAGGGAIVCEVSPGSGSEFVLMQARMVNSGTNGANIQLATAVAGTIIVRFAAVASGVATSATFPRAVANSTTTGADASSVYPVIVSGTMAVAFAQSGAGVQNDTLQVICVVRLKGGLPTAVHSSSTNPANVSVTAGAESFATV